jgi:hypothetical protein
MNENMNVPLSIIIEQTKQEIVNTLNNSHLHPSIMEMIMSVLYSEVKHIADEELYKERQKLMTQTPIHTNDIEIINQEEPA